MKKGLTKVMLCLALLIVSGCAEGNKISTWMLTGQDASMVGRVGVAVDEPQILEAGLTVKFWTPDLEGDIRPNAGGIYLIRQLTQEITIEDTPEASPFGPILEGLTAIPYIGVEMVVPWKDAAHHPARLNAIGGIVFELGEDGQLSIITEGMAGDGMITSEDDSGGPTADDWGAFIGLKGEGWPFKF